MSKLKLFSIELIIALLIGLFSSYLYIYKTSFFENMNKKFTDMFFKYRGELKPSENIVIVDIDEKSLAKLGQWPWGRDKVSQILDNLDEADVAIVGLDIVFAESDNSSPKKVLDKLGIVNKNVKDYDLILAKTLAKTPTILGYIFDFEKKIKKGKTPNISTIIIEKNYKNIDFLPNAKGLITNIPLLQENSYSSGFFNTIPDNDGVVRSVPLAAKYEDVIFPSLTLEMLRIIYGSDKIVLEYGENGINSIYIEDLKIPTDRFGRLSVNYRGKSKLYKYISAVDIYNKTFSKEDIANKIVLIGTSAAGLLDLRATPLDNVFAGVEIHATVIDNILNQDFISYPSWIEAVDIFNIILILLITVLLFIFFGALKTAILSIFVVCGFLYISFYMFVHEGIILNIIYPLFSWVALYMILTSLHYLFETKQKELIKNKFSKKVSKAVADSLIRQGNKDILEVKEKEITIFFSDIRGFTSISEELNNPKKLVDFLNLYMTPMTEIITTNQGTVDKFIGDAIMAYWNAPLEIKNHADMAVKSAIEQQNKLKNLNVYLKEKSLPNIEIGIGINSGLAIIGEMGSIGRSDYTVIGDSINLGSRLEGLCKIYGVKIIISEFTKELLNQKYFIRFIDKVRVKGKNESVDIYEILLNDYKNKDIYNEAILYYQKANFIKSLEKFKFLYDKSDIILYKLYISRCEFFIQNPPEQFDGVFKFTTK